MKLSINSLLDYSYAIYCRELLSFCRSIAIFDYTDAQINIMLVTGADQNMDSLSNADKLERIKCATYQGAAQCREVIECIQERLTSKRRSSTIIKNVQTTAVQDIHSHRA